MQKFELNILLWNWRSLLTIRAFLRICFFICSCLASARGTDTWCLFSLSRLVSWHWGQKIVAGASSCTNGNNKQPTVYRVETARFNNEAPWKAVEKWRGIHYQVGVRRNHAMGSASAKHAQQCKYRNEHHRRDSELYTCLSEVDSAMRNSYKFKNPQHFVST